jgi:hypothetical protein
MLNERRSSSTGIPSRIWCRQRKYDKAEGLKAKFHIAVNESPQDRLRDGVTLRRSHGPITSLSVRVHVSPPTRASDRGFVKTDVRERWAILGVDYVSQLR